VKKYTPLLEGFHMRAFGIGLLLVGVAVNAFAVPVPEIDPASGVNALALLGGAALVIRSWRRK
jgi:hypothetical protein